MTNNLKPCPFCGSRRLKIISQYVGSDSRIECLMCGGLSGACRSQPKAVELWNRRDGDKELAKEAYQAGCDAEKIAEFGGSLTFEEWWRMKENE